MIVFIFKSFCHYKRVKSLLLYGKLLLFTFFLCLLHSSILAAPFDLYKCRQYQDLYLQSWPCICDEVHSRDHLQSCVEAAKQRQSEGLKEECNSTCSPYIQRTTEGCRGTIQDTKYVCNQICQNVYEHIKGYQGEKYEAIESQVPNRGRCIEESKIRFLNTYKEACVNTLAEIEQAKGESTKLLCGGNATKDNPQCDQYCIKKAEKFYGPDLTPQDIVNQFYSTNMASQDANSFNMSKAYNVLIAVDEGIQHIVQNEVSKIQNDLFRQNGELTRKAKSAGLQWWQCRRDENMECEANVKLTLETAVTVCSELQTEALECCHEPEQCVGGALAHTLDGLGKVNIAIGGIKGRKEQCQAVRQTHGMYAGMQGAMAAQCIRKANNCIQKCQEAVNIVIEAFEQACNHNPLIKEDYNESKHSCDEDFFKHYTEQYKSSNNEKQVSISKVPEECKRTGKESNRRIQDMSTNIGTSLLASVKECGQEEESFAEWPGGTTGSVTPPDPPPPPPGELPTPQIGGGGDISSPPGGGSPFGDDGGMPQAANPFDLEPMDMGDEALMEQGGAKNGFNGGLITGSGNGGSGGGLGSGGGGGGSGSRGRGRGLKKAAGSLLKGLTGGKYTGYGGGGGFGSKGGNKGRGLAAKGKKAKKKKFSLDLKKMVPRDKKAPFKRTKVHSAHLNIFEIISIRYKAQCQEGKLIGCPMGLE